ncbi:MAG: HYR domain-containing protein [Saprospiraceae bacterium]|nr:HYR domain-containing protein [Saprospiraceae bacterium]
MGPSLMFNCTHIGNASIFYYVRIVPAGDPATSPNASTAINIHVTVKDVHPPTIMNIPDVALGTDPSTLCGRVVTGIDAMYDDNCGVTDLTWVATGATSLTSLPTGINQASGTQFNVGVTILTYTAEDASGNTTTESFTITITDDDQPTLVCPGLQLRNTDPNLCTAVVNGLAPSVTENCAATVTWTAPGATPASGSNDASGAVFPLGNTTVTYTAKDVPNPAVMCSFTVTVTDNQAPTISASPAALPFNATPNNGAALSVGTSTAPGAPLCDGKYEWRHPMLTDNCTPLAFPPASFEIEISGMTTVLPTAVTMGANYTQIFNLGLSTITYTAEDNNGITSTWTFTVNIVDNVPATVVFDPADGSGVTPTTSSYTAPANNCFANVTIEQPNLAVTDPVYCGGLVPPQAAPCSNYTTTDCGAITITRLPNPVIDGFVPPFNPLDPLNRTLTANFPVGIGPQATIIHYHVTDANGNTTTLSISVNVTEATPPTALCILPTTVALDVNGVITIDPIFLDNGSSDNCGGVVFSATPNSFSCADVGMMIPVTLLVEDIVGNFASCMTTLSIVDITAPQVVCPLPITVNTAPGICTATGLTAANLTAGIYNALNPGQWDDNCSPTTITWTVSAPSAGAGVGAGTLSSHVFNKGVSNVQYTLDDPSNPSVNCNFTVTVLDNQAPVASNCPSNITVNANIAPGCSYKKPNSSPCIVDVNIPANQWCGSVNFTDNCDGASVVSNLASLTQTYSLGTNPISITKTDAAGNMTTCTFNLTVVDVQPPTAICQNITAQLDAGGNVTVTALQVNNNSIDNCYLDLLYAVKKPVGAYGPSVSYTCADIGPQTVTLRVTEDVAGGLTATANCVVTVEDKIKPLCSAQNIVRILSGTNPGMVTVNAADLNLSSSDNCLGALSYKMSTAATGPFTSTLAFDCTPLGPNTVYLQVTDAHGNTSDPNVIPCTATVTIQDVSNPSVVSAPGNSTVSCNTVTPSVAAYVASLPDATFADNCSVVNVAETFTTTPGACPDAYIIHRSWIATDAAGLTVQAIQTITVQDVTKPTITLPANVTLNLSNYMTCTPSASYTAVLSDNCSTSGLLATNTTWVIDYPGILPLNTNGSGVTATPVGGYRLGLNVITFTTTDACGNVQNNTMNVTVVDDVVPVFSSYNIPFTMNNYCGQAFVYANTPNTCGYTFNWVRPWFGDITDCSNLTFAPESIVAVTPMGMQTLIANFPWDPINPLTEFVPVSINLPVGTTTFTYKVTDAAGNMSTCSFTVQVTDTQVPTLVCPANLTLNTICPTSSVPDFRNLVNTTDNCFANILVSQTKIGVLLGNTVALAYTTAPPNPADDSQFSIMFVATDGTNNSLPCTTIITLNDTDAPIPSAGSLLPIVSDCGYAIVSAPTAFPNCGTTPLIYGTPGGVSATPYEVVGMNILKYKVTGVGNFFITWSYDDGNGNVTTQLQQLTINADTEPPIAKCKAGQTIITLSATFPATASITPQMIDADNGSFSVNGSHDPDACFLPTPPPALPTRMVDLSLSQSIFTCADLNATMVTLTATDYAGNTATCTASIQVVDINPPVYQMPLPSFAPLTVECGDTLPVGATLVAIDNCADTILVAPVDVPVSNPIICGQQATKSFIRTWSVTDNINPPVVFTQDIIVLDTKSPEWQAAAPTMVMVSTPPVSTVCQAPVTLQVANTWVSDDCVPFANLTLQYSVAGPGMIPNVGCSPANGCASGIYNVGTHLVTFTATDPCGNTAQHTVTVVVKDATPPTAVCINGISIALNPNGQAIVTPNLVNNNSNDNCIAPLSFLVQELESPNGDTIGDPHVNLVFDCDQADSDTEYPVILIVTDAGGNYSICETTVVVQDNVTPTITCPANITVDCDVDLDPYENDDLGIAGAVDNCPSNLDTFYTDLPMIILSDTCPTITRTWSAVDLAGNLATCSQTITIHDDKKPKFTIPLPQNDTITCFQADMVPVLAATDNCTPPDEILIELVEVFSDTAGVCGKYDYKVTRTWTATDKCGNTTAHVQVVLVQDTLAPSFFLPPNKTINQLSANALPTTNCTVPIVYNLGSIGVFNECASLIESTVDSIKFVPIPLNPITPNVLDISGHYPVGTTKVYFWVTDPCGNQGFDTLTINIIDNSLPIAICNNNVVVALGTGGVVSITADDIDLNSNDNCGIDTMFLSRYDFDCTDLGFQPDTLFVTDVYGNTNFCVVQVEITLGSTIGFTLTTSATAETYLGAANGTATAVATGGTGAFTYLWSNGATTASISNIAAGTYTVTVSDTQSGCFSTATVTVLAGPTITITVGSGNACQGQIISIPVRADNFINVTGFNLGLDLGNVAVGTIIGLTNINPALVNLVPGVNSVFWTHITLTPTSLPNGSVLFNVEIQLSNAAVGTTSSIIASFIPGLLFLQDTTNQAPVVNFNNGTATISCPAPNDLEIAGDVFTWKAPVKPVPGVEITLDGTITGTDVTALPDADYNFFVTGGSNTQVTADKVATTKNSQINVGDMLGIQAHAALQVAFNNGYQWVAADVNGDQRVNLLDYALVQKYILTPAIHFTDNQGLQVGPDWKFIPELHMFLPLPLGNPMPPMLNPLNNPIPPSSIIHNNIQINFLDDDFVGVLMGDVNGSVMPSLTNGGGGTESSEALKFRLNERAIQAGETVTIPFKALDFNGAQAYQMTIGFDPEVLELQDIQPGVLPGLTEGNFGTEYLVDGLLSTLWVGGKPSYFNDNETLFSLTFRALENVPTLSGVLHSSSAITEALAIDAEGKSISVDFDFQTSVATGELEHKIFALYQNQPNPFTSETTISFRLPESGRATLRVFSAEGRLVKTVIGDFAEGNNAIKFQKGDFGSNGVFYYELETPKHSDRKKMILID